MAAITDEEMLDVLERAGNGERRVEMRKEGIWLHAAGETREISFAQADVLFTTMFGHATS